MILAYAWKELTRRKTRTTLAVMSIFFAIGLFTAVLATLNFFKEAVSLPFKAAGADMVVETYVEPGPWKRVRLARHLGAIPISVVDEFRALPEVASVSGLLLFWSWEAPRMVNICALNPEELEEISPIASRTPIGQAFVSLEMVNPNFEGRRAVLDKRYAEKFGLTIGSTIELAGRKFEVVGLADYKGVPRVGQAEVFIPLKEGVEMVKESHEYLRNMDAFVNMILVRLKPGTEPKAVESKIRQILAKATGLDPKQQIRVFTSETILPDTVGVSLLTQQMFRVIAIIMLVGIALLVAKTSVMAVAERTSEIGIMKATGWQDSDIAKLILTESALQGLIGGVLGCVAGYLIAYIYAATAEFKLPHPIVPYSCLPAAAPPQNLVVAMKVSWPLVIAAILIALAMGVLGGYFAAKRAASLHPAEALRRL